MIIAEKTCKVDGCDRLDYIKTKRLKLGLCPMHYSRFKISGDAGDCTFKHILGQNRKTNPLYSIYNNMIQRCYNPNVPNYSHYGAKGITVFDDWCDKVNGFNRFESYILDNLGSRPTLAHSIDRVDNLGNYEPGNLRWLRPTQQNINRSKQSNNTTGHTGVYPRKLKGKTVWFATVKLHRKVTNLGTFETLQEAVNARKSAEKEFYLPELENA